MITHLVKWYLFNKPVISNKANNSITILKPINSPTEDLDVGIVQFTDTGGARVLGISLANTGVDLRIFTVLVVVVLVDLSDVVGRVANDDRDRHFLLASHASSILLGHKREC